MTAVFTGCGLVDEDLTECESDYAINYELRLITNMTTELQTQLGVASSAPVAGAIKTRLSGIFTDYAHDVDLAFYDVSGDGPIMHHERHMMDAYQTSYTLHIPVHEYMHVAVANLSGSEDITLEQSDHSHSAHLQQVVRDTVDSQKAGIFSARLPMDVQEGEDQQFDVKLYMVTAASALVLDTLDSHVRDIRVFASGFAAGFNLADSTYIYYYTPVVRSDRLDAGTVPGTPLCYLTVNFPSRDVKETKSQVEDNRPFISGVADEPLWQYKVYALLKDGSVTETVVGVKVPLRAGQLKVITANVSDDGSVVPRGPYVGAVVTLNWSQGTTWDIDF